MFEEYHMQFKDSGEEDYIKESDIDWVEIMLM